jgi:DNA-binding NtrC family response regulator
MARILIVEDEEQVRVLAESYLREQGHVTLSAATPVEALAALGVAEGIHLIFVDIGIHGDPHAGLNLAKEAIGRKPDLKVLHVTWSIHHRRHEGHDGRRVRAIRKALHPSSSYSTR